MCSHSIQKGCDGEEEKWWKRMVKITSLPVSHLNSNWLQRRHLCQYKYSKLCQESNGRPQKKNAKWMTLTAFKLGMGDEVWTKRLLPKNPFIFSERMNLLHLAKVKNTSLIFLLKLWKQNQLKNSNFCVFLLIWLEQSFFKRKKYLQRVFFCWKDFWK